MLKVNMFHLLLQSRLVLLDRSWRPKLQMHVRIFLRTLVSLPRKPIKVGTRMSVLHVINCIRLFNKRID